MELHDVSYGIEYVARPLLLFFSSENRLLWFRYREYDLAHLKLVFEFSIYNVWKSVQYGVSNGLDTAYWGFLGVGTTFDIFQNIHILYLRYGVLSLSGYGVLSFIPLWSLVSAGTDTPYLLDGYGVLVFRIVKYCEDKDDCFTNFDTEFLAIVYDDTLTSDATLLFEPTLKTDSEMTIISYMPSFPSVEPTVSYFDDLDHFKDFENEFSAIVYNDALTSKLEPTISPQHIDEFN
ncbi:hypothetical protein Tco_1102668 [Tanacetum coccineum]